MIVYMHLTGRSNELITLRIRRCRDVWAQASGHTTSLKLRGWWEVKSRWVGVNTRLGTTVHRVEGSPHCGTVAGAALLDTGSPALFAKSKVYKCMLASGAAAPDGRNEVKRQWGEGSWYSFHNFLPNAFECTGVEGW